MIINAPRRCFAGRAPGRAGVTAVDVWRERMRAHPQCRLPAADRQRTPRGGRLAAAHPRPALRAGFVPAAVARERERAAPTRRARWAEPARRPRREEVRRRERIVAIDEEAVLMAPYASRVPFQLMLAPRRPRHAFRGRRADGRGAAPRGLRRLARHSAPPAAEPVGPHRAAGGRALLLAHRRAPAPDPPGGPGALPDLNLNIVAPEEAAAGLREA